MAGDPYKELGVPRNASQDDIRKAFRKLAKELHPDRNPGDAKAEERFKRVSGAFDILGDEAKRRKFDRGEIDAEGREQFRGFPGGGARAGGPGDAGARFEGVDLDDLFGGMFGGMGGMRSGARGFSTRGQDVRAQMQISLEDAITGAVRRIAFSDGRTLDVSIPKGATDGQVMRLKGQGAPGRNGEPGDALIELVIAPHPVFRRDGADLHMDLSITVPDAVLGGKVSAPTPEGPVSLNVPKGSNSGRVLRLRGRGAYAKGKRGDLLARLVVTLPDTPDDKLIRFCEEWRAKRPYKP